MFISSFSFFLVLESYFCIFDEFLDDISFPLPKAEARTKALADCDDCWALSDRDMDSAKEVYHKAAEKVDAPLNCGEMHWIFFLGSVVCSVFAGSCAHLWDLLSFSSGSSGWAKHGDGQFWVGISFSLEREAEGVHPCSSWGARRYFGNAVSLLETRCLFHHLIFFLFLFL